MVAVLLPFRDAANTLDAAIASIVEQSFREWRLLLIDNASSAASRAIADQWALRESRITVMGEPLVGIAHALNTGLQHADASLIARMDADDIAHPDRLAMQVAFLDAHPEIGVLGTRTRFETTVVRSSGMRWFVEWQNALLTPHEHYVKRFVDAPLAHPTAMFRRELFEQHGGYSTDPLPEDHELWLRWMHAGVRFAKLPDELLTWNDHADRLSRTHPNYSTEAFFRTKARWMARWLARTLNGRPVIIAGTSALCQSRVRMLEEQGIRVAAFTDVRRREVPGFAFIPHDRLPPAGEAFIVSFISQRGTGDRIAAFLASRGLVEGVDFILAA
ncbi:MAG: glycosyltransferase family 2 protein [Flavobacteriales bacterium]|nr:glycosyltransferase family 2 protein [Flavobacteriales bacterium]